MLALIFVYILTISIVFLLILAWQRHHKQQIFKRYNIPHVDNINLFSGNMFELVIDDDNVKNIQKKHEQLGNTFGMYYGETPWILTRDPELIYRIFVTDGHKLVNVNRYFVPVPEFTISVAQVQDNQWRRQRKTIAPTFTHNKMKKDNVFEDIEDVLKTAINSIEKKMKINDKDKTENSCEIEIVDLTKRFSFEVILRLGFGAENHINFDTPKDEFLDLMVQAEGLLKHPVTWVPMMFPTLLGITTMVASLSTLQRNLRKILKFLQKNSIDRIERHHKLQQQQQQQGQLDDENTIGNQIDSVANDKYKRRMIDSLVESYRDGQMTFEELEGNCIFLIAAGFETTASTATILCYFLARYPEVQNKLRLALASCGDVDDKCEYFDLVIKEVLRLYPSVPGFIGREVKDEIITREGYKIQPGWSIVPSYYAIHRDKKLWGEDANRFNPDRFLDTSNHIPGQYIPFALGPRNCIGGKLAVIELRLFFSSILLRYRLEPGSEGNFSSDQLNFKSPNLLHIILRDKFKLKFIKLETTYLN